MGKPLKKLSPCSIQDVRLYDNSLLMRELYGAFSVLMFTRKFNSGDGKDEFVILVPGYEEPIVVRFFQSASRFQARVGIQAPKEFVIMRGELMEQHKNPE